MLKQYKFSKQKYFDWVKEHVGVIPNVDMVNNLTDCVIQNCQGDLFIIPQEFCEEVGVCGNAN